MELTGKKVILEWFCGEKEKKAEAQSGGLEVAALLVMLQEEKITSFSCRRFLSFFLSLPRFFENIETFRVSRAGLSVHSASLVRL